MHYFFLQNTKSVGLVAICVIMLVILYIYPYSSFMYINIRPLNFKLSIHNVSDLIYMVSRAIWQTSIYILTARDRNFRRTRSDYLQRSPFSHLARLYFKSSTCKRCQVNYHVSKRCQGCPPLCYAEWSTAAAVLCICLKRA